MKKGSQGRLNFGLLTVWMVIPLMSDGREVRWEESDIADFYREMLSVA